MYHLSEESGTHFITMEYIPGQDLKGLIRQSGQLAAGTTINIAKQICEGLAEAHRLGVVHRDLKPSNIMIDKDGNARIMDFGIAHSLEAKGITGAGVMIGIPEYMSPEQVEAKEVDHRSDIYSLGMILYEMATGQLPFEGDTPLAIAMRQKSQMPKDPREFNTQIPEELNRVILRCLEKDKEKRYQSTGELFSELTDIEKGVLTTERMVPKKGPKEVIDSIAVLPLANISGNPEHEYIADGMTEALISKLAQIKALKVISRQSVMRYKRSDKPLPEIARELGVDAVIEGSVLWAGHRVRITSQLIEGATDRHLWAKDYEQDPHDILALHGEMAREIAHEVKIAVTSKEESHLARSRKIDPLLPINYNELGWALQIAGNYDDALEQYQRALKLDPEFHQTHWALAYTYFEKGMYEEAITHYQKLMSLAGELPFYAAFPGYIYGMADRRSEALEILDSLKERSKKEYISSAIALIYIGLGEKDQAIEWLERAYKEHDIFLVWLKIGFTFDSLRDDPRFQDLLRRMNFLD